MGKMKSRMDEGILVCVYYGPNGERLINRGYKIATIMDCPFYILTVDPAPLDDFHVEKSEYIDRWKELAEELDVEAFIIRDDEKLPAAKVIKEVAHQYGITQIIIGQTAQSRWEEITKGSFMNVLLREIPFVDFHVVSVDRAIKSEIEGSFEKGVRAYLISDGEGFRINFTLSKHAQYEGIFFKEIGTDFNNGVFKFMQNSKICQVQIEDDQVLDSSKIQCKIQN
ncbi:histidine kinase [Sporosarcina sp. P2]|uniref:histidine kinase n=1 Tax=Sporosarcina sp. P2 TaxID=2048251 RepID=UPI000C164039|nr:histidine kinase [Sporosarcina sp. P2]PID01220.1 histidine kinase [Sporosarcina sp. P2]